MKEDVSRILRAAQDGDGSALEQLMPLVHEELRGLAAREMARERQGHTLQPTALVNEAWLRLSEAPLPPGGRALFFHAAAMSMRRILIDHARRRAALKRGSALQGDTFSDVAVGDGTHVLELLALEDALDALEARDAHLARVVELKFFTGLTTEEVAGLLEQSVSRITRDWLYARAWLRDHLRDDRP